MILEYIIQVILFQLAFLLVYEIFLKKETFFNYNRFYLLFTPIIALLLPLLKLEFLVDVVPQNARITLPEVFIGNRETAIETLHEVTVSEKTSVINWWLATYILGFIFSLFLFLKKYNNLNRLFRFRKISEEKDFRIIEIPNSNLAFTFFNTVFLGEQLSENEKQQILSHELVHVKQKHSFDLIFFELLKIIFWFNPLIYVYQSRIAGLHEFIADDEVVKSTEKKTYYEQLLNTAFNTQNISFINQFFNHSLIKKRIIMLQKNKSSKLSKFKFLLIIPLMLAMLTYVACSEESTPLEEQNASIIQKITELENALSSKNNLTVEELNAFENLQKSAASKVETIEVVETKGQDFKDTVPYAIIDKVPAFPGCEKWEDDVRKNCTSGKISEFVHKNFDTSIGKEVGLEGTNRVIVQFRIDTNGNIQDVRSRAASPELEKEAERVINSLPQMQPGEQNGRPVSVMYSLPISFKVGA